MPASLLLPKPNLPAALSAPGMGWGILGPGWIASQFARSLNNLTVSKVAAVGSRSLNRSQQFAAEFGDENTRAYGSYAEVLEDPSVEVIYVAVPHSGHHALALQAINAGKHVLVEKPFALNAVQAQEMADAARAAGVFVMEAMWSRLLPVGNVIRQVLDSGMLGQILSINADFASQFEVDLNSRIYDPALGGGALLDLGIYPVALSAMVSPAREVAHAAGRMTSTGVDATFNAVINNHDGSTTSVFSSIEVTSPHRAWIAGTKATLEIGPPIYAATRLVLRGADGQLADSQEFVEHSPETGLGWEAAHVAWCISQGLTQSPLMPLEETITIARTLDEIASKLRANAAATPQAAPAG